MDEDLFARQVQIERKTITFTLRQNPRGRFLRITEDVGSRRDTVIIPATGLDAILATLQEIRQIDKNTPPAPART